MDTLIIAVSAFGGAAIAGFAGWLKSGNPWNTRTYLTTVVSGIGTAIVFALAYQFSEGGIRVYDILAAVAAGAGVDNLVNRISGTFTRITMK
jgi:hypothetical protein